MDFTNITWMSEQGFLKLYCAISDAVLSVLKEDKGNSPKYRVRIYVETNESLEEEEIK
jgi:hypothetical protein